MVSPLSPATKKIVDGCIVGIMGIILATMFVWCLVGAKW